MTRTIELKHVGPKEHVHRLIDELLDRLEQKLRHFPSDVVSFHVLFEENGSHRVYRTSVTCHVPGRMVAAHEESRDAGVSIRKAFRELGRQLAKQHGRLRQRDTRRRQGAAQRLEGGTL